MTTGRLAGKRAIVTGAASGIGLACATRFAAEGATVCLWDRDGAAARSAATSIVGAIAVAVDVSDPDSIAAAADQSVRAMGGLDVLMNNAGILDDYAPILETDEALWDRIMGVNLKGVFLVTRALLPSMLDSGGGVIVNTASIAGMVAGGGGTAYTAAKHGVVGLTKQLAFDYGKHGIRTNAIAPGAVETGMTRALFEQGDASVMDSVNGVPAGRYAQPEEMASLALFLASDESAFVHGAVYVADGGWTIQ